ncbi:MAG: signal transduction histidine kinase [Planctomycetota bacterium]|jgi:signal transduction histidine kinase
MTGLSLRARVLLLITLLNAVLFVLGGAYLRERLRTADDEQLRFYAEDVLGSGLSSNLDKAGDLKVGPILRFESWELLRSWGLLEDAILVGSRNLTRGTDRVVAGGIDLNPLGSSHRLPGFDRQAILSALLAATESRATVLVAGGRAIPFETDGLVWGAGWFKVNPPGNFLELFRRLLPLFLGSTMLLILGTFWFLREIVLDPVKMLAEGAQRVSAGDLTVSLPESDRHDELAELVRTFNQMTSTVRGFNETMEEKVRVATEMTRAVEQAAMTQRRLAAMGELAAGIAHEINNPLGGMLNAVEVLSRDDITPEKRSRYGDLVSRGLGRIGETVSRLRRFTPREAAKEMLDLEPIVQDGLALVRHRVDRLGIELKWTAPMGAIPKVSGARNEVGQALLNLLANAIDSLEEFGLGSLAKAPMAVSVTLESKDDEVHLGVADNGPGVSEEELGRIADLFYTTKEVGKGTGLGLALIHRAMGELGGRVVLTSEEGAGLRGVLIFPVAQELSARTPSP